MLSHVQLFATPWTSPPGSSVYGIFEARILEWQPFPTPEDLSDPGMEPVSSASPALADRFFVSEPPGDRRLKMVTYWSNANT